MARGLDEDAGSWRLARIESGTSERDAALTNHAARPFAGGGGGRLRGSFQASDRNFEAGHALLTGHRRNAAGAHGVEERDQFGTQWLIVADRQMTHGITAVRLEAE